MENEIKTNGKPPFIIVIPIFNDWEALGLLIQRLDPIIARLGVKCTLIIVNDGSTEPYDASSIANRCNAIENINVLSLLRNLGHQRAITIGLAYVYENIPDALTLVMDGDGEDDPENIDGFLHEEWAGGRISNDNVLKVLDPGHRPPFLSTSENRG